LSTGQTRVIIHRYVLMLRTYGRALSRIIIPFILNIDVVVPRGCVWR
jgi:hypothetical protein